MSLVDNVRKSPGFITGPMTGRSVAAPPRGRRSQRVSSNQCLFFLTVKRKPSGGGSGGGGGGGGGGSGDVMQLFPAQAITTLG